MTSLLSNRVSRILTSGYLWLVVGTFLIGGGGGGGGGPGLRRGGSLLFFLTNWGGSNLFYSQPGEGNSFFWQGKNYSMSLLFCIYKQINLNYFTGVEKFTYQKTIFSQLT